MKILVYNAKKGDKTFRHFQELGNIVVTHLNGTEALKIHGGAVKQAHHFSTFDFTDPRSQFGERGKKIEFIRANPEAAGSFASLLLYAQGEKEGFTRNKDGFITVHDVIRLTYQKFLASQIIRWSA